MKTLRASLGALFLSFLATGPAGCGDDDSGGKLPDAAVDSGASGTGGGQGGSGGKDTTKPLKDAGQSTDAGEPMNPVLKPVKFMVPKNGGTTKVTLEGGHEVAFTFPGSAAGKEITLTPTTAASIGWPTDQFSAVIRMEPDGLKFQDPVIVTPSKGEMLLATFAESQERRAGEMLELAKNQTSDKIEGLALHHFTLLGIIAAEFSCNDHNGWKATPNSQRCTSTGSATTYLEFVCDASPLCWTITGHCCAAPGSTECHYTDPLAALSATWQGPLGDQFPWCGPVVAMDAGHDAGHDASADNDEDASVQGGSGGTNGSGGTTGGSGGTTGGSGGTTGGSGGQQGDDAGAQGSGGQGGSGGTTGGSGGTQGGTGGQQGDDAGVQGSGGQGGSGGTTGGSGGQGSGGQGSGGTQGGSGGTGASSCKNPSDVDCGTGCVDLTSNTDHCGQCNHPCSTACVESQCATAVIGATCSGAPFKVVLNPNVPNWSDFALYDMNGDTKLDLVGGNLYEIDVHTGVGDGTFNTGVQTGNNDGYKLAVGDFDHDGHGDVANWNPDVAYGGTPFGAATFTQISYTPPMMFWGGFTQNTISAPIATGDFNGDGASDIAEFTSGNNGVSELFMMGNRQYASSSTVAIGGVATGIATGDFTGDGKDDVALIIPGTALKIYPSPLDANTEITLGADNSGSSIAFGKLDFDNKADIAIAHPSANEVGVVFAGFAGGTSIYTIPIHADQVAIGDFTHDGKRDIVALSGSALVILPGTGQAGFLAPLGPFALSPTAYNQVHTGDVDGDQTTDLVRRTYSGSGGYGFESLVTCPAVAP